MEIWIIRFVMIAIVPAISYACWKISGWLLEAEFLPGVGETAPQAVGALVVFMAFAMLVTVINWFLVDNPREKAKEEFWKKRGKSWPR